MRKPMHIAFVACWSFPGAFCPDGTPPAARSAKR